MGYQQQHKCQHKKNKGSLKICSQSSYFNQFGSLAVLHYLEFS